MSPLYTRLYTRKVDYFLKKLKLLPTLLSKIIIKCAYIIFCIFFKVNPTKITFASTRSKEISGNLEYVWKEFKRREPDYQYVLSFYKMNSSVKGKLSYIIHMIKDCYHLATSKFFIIDDYYFSVYAIHPRQGTEIIQLWHACGAFKKFGMSTVGKAFGPSEDYLNIVPVHTNYSRVYVSSSEIIPFYAEAFNMNQDQIYSLGIPRTDYFFDSIQQKDPIDRLHETYPLLKGKKIILYAPTFRGESYQQEMFTSPIDFKLLEESLSEEYRILVHLHPYMTSFQVEKDLQEFVIHIKNDYTIEELLLLTDVLITDYSSIIFDYSLLSKPIAFFAHDLEEYIQERDFYYDYQTFVPGPIFTKTDELRNWLLNGNFDLDKIIAFKNRFFDYTDGKATQRIVSHLLND